MRARSCPVCSSGLCETFYEVSVADAAQHYILREENSKRHAALERHIAKLWGAPQCAIRQCAECEFVFADPYVAGDIEFYNLAYDRSGYPGEKWEFKRTVAELTKMRFKGARVLEVGAGHGMFLDQISDVFVPRSGVTAVEFNSQAVEVLRCKQYAVHQEDVRSATLDGHFDAVFLFQVLEHMDELDGLFARLAQLTLQDRPVFIGVPNPRRMRFNEENSSLRDCPPNHIGRWSMKALEIIGRRHALLLEHYESEPFSLAEFVRQDIVYSYLHAAQRSGSFANRVRASAGARNRPLQGAAAAFMAPRAHRRMAQGFAHGRSRRHGLGETSQAVIPRPVSPTARQH